MGLLQATLHNKATIPAGGFHLRGAVAPRMYIYFDLPKSWTSVQGNLRTALEVPPHMYVSYINRRYGVIVQPGKSIRSMHTHPLDSLLRW